jgi:hypothetical protein
LQTFTDACIGVCHTQVVPHVFHPRGALLHG